MARSTSLRSVPRDAEHAPRRGAPGPALAADEASRALTTRDGARVTLVGEDALEFRDREGRLLIRYVDGGLEVAPPTGDLTLRAPAGHVRIEAAMDVSLGAGRDLSLGGERLVRVAARAASSEHASQLELTPSKTTLSGRTLELHSLRARFLASAIEQIAVVVKTSAAHLETHTRTLDTTAERIATRAKEAAMEIADLLETRAGRARSIVSGDFGLISRTTTLESEEDTSIDGRRVLLG